MDHYHRELKQHILDVCGGLVQVLPGNSIDYIHNTARKSVLSPVLDLKNRAGFC